MKYLSKIILCSLLTVHCSLFTSSQVQSPKDFFGYEPGSDGNLFSYEQLIDYLQQADKASPMVEMREIGTSPMGKPMYICFISSEENIARLDELKEINRKLALDASLTVEEQQRLVGQGKVFFLATLSMHSTEVAPSQSAPTIAYSLLTNDSNETTEALKNVVYMMVPCHNPDGMDMVVEHYNKYKGTKYDGSQMPGVYHKYVGHDNNRDFVILSQDDTKAIARIYNLDWFPQVMVEKHQMGSTGVRYFVPPPHDPIAENVDAALWNWIGVFGSGMIKDMTKDGLTGIAQRYIFDDYWPGSTETCIWKNVIGMLTEAASTYGATPIYIEPSEIKVGGKGLAEYKKSINMPELWPGGWWRLSDLISYEQSSTFSIIRTASQNKDAILHFRNDLCKEEVNKGETEPPYYYILPLDQPDKGELVRLVNLLIEHGIRVYQLTSPAEIKGLRYDTGDIVVPLAQPFRAFIKEVMEHQHFPVRHYTPGGEMIRPYDITSWSLPLHNGVECLEIKDREVKLTGQAKEITGTFSLRTGLSTEFWGIALSSEMNESYKAAFYAKELGFNVKRMLVDSHTNNANLPAGSFLITGRLPEDQLVRWYELLTVDPVFLSDDPGVETEEFAIPRIALVETNMHDIDAGWTRFLFDTYHISYEIIKPENFEKVDLSSSYDLIIFPSNNKDILMEGKYKGREGEYYMSSYPPEFVKGMGKKGFENLLKFVDGGGDVISWGSSTELFTGVLSITKSETESDDFKLPINNISNRIKDFSCPGTWLKVNLRPDNPLTWGMPTSTGVFMRSTPVFDTELPRFDMDRRIIATFPEKDMLISGYVENEELIGNKAAMVWLKKGKGQLILFAFNPQFRNSTAADYKLLFNSILLGDKVVGH